MRRNFEKRMNDNYEDSVRNDPQFERFFEALAQKQQYQILVHNLTDICWDLCCDFKPSVKLEGKVKTCLNNCVDRFVDTTVYIVNRMEKHHKFNLSELTENEHF